MSSTSRVGVVARGSATSEEWRGVAAHGAQRRSSSAAPLPPLRLTRRGWGALVAAALVLVALATLALSAALGPSGELQLAGESSVVVQPGDTVWSIAAELAGPRRDVREVVDAIRRLNGLRDALVVPGQVLELP